MITMPLENLKTSEVSRRKNWWDIFVQLSNSQSPTCQLKRMVHGFFCSKLTCDRPVLGAINVLGTSKLGNIWPKMVFKWETAWEVNRGPAYKTVFCKNTKSLQPAVHRELVAVNKKKHFTISARLIKPILAKAVQPGIHFFVKLNSAESSWEAYRS